MTGEVVPNPFGQPEDGSLATELEPPPQPAAAGPAPAEPAAAEPIRRHQVARFVLGRGIAGLGDQFLLFAIPLLTYRLTGSASMTGLIFLVEWLPRVCFLPIAGVFADRFMGYRLYLGSDTIRATLALGAFALIRLAPGLQFLTLCVLAAGMSLASAQAYVAMETTLPRFVPMDQMIRAQSTIQGTEQGSEILGPVLAAALSSVIGTSDLLVVISVVYALTALNIFTLRRPLLRERVDGAVPEGTTVRSVVSGVVDGAATLRRLPAILGLVGLTMTVNLMVGVGLATSAAITTGTYGKPDRYFGILSTIAGLVGFLTFFLVPKISKHISPFLAIMLSYALVCIGGIGISRSTNFVEFAISYAVLLGPIGFFNVFIRAERIKRIPREHLGKTIGLIILLNQISLPLAGLLVAAFAVQHDPRTVVLGAVVGSVCTVVLLIPLLLQLRSPHAHPGPASNHE